MTTIAYDGSCLASDTLSQGGGMRLGRVQKIWRLADGRLFGACGDNSACEAAYRWLESGGHPETRPTLKTEQGFNGLLIGGDGQVTSFDPELVALAIAAPFYAIGSGREFAMGAMAAGETACAAVRIALQFDIYSGGPLDLLVLHDPLKDRVGKDS